MVSVRVCVCVRANACIYTEWSKSLCAPDDTIQKVTSNV